jgi:hypothetical protein
MPHATRLELGFTLHLLSTSNDKLARKSSDSLGFLGWIRTRVFVQALVDVIIRIAPQQTCSTPLFNRILADAEDLRNLCESEQASLAKAIVASLEAVGASHHAHGDGVEGEAHTRAQAALVENGSDFPVIMMVQ